MIQFTHVLTTSTVGSCCRSGQCTVQYKTTHRDWSTGQNPVSQSVETAIQGGTAEKETNKQQKAKPAQYSKTDLNKP